MIEAPHYSAEGAKRENALRLPEDYFDGTVNEPVLHQAIKTYLNNQRQGTATDQDPELRLRRQPEALEAEGHRPGPAGLDPRAALAGWRHRLRADPARLPHRHPEEGAPAGPEARAQCAGPGRLAHVVERLAFRAPKTAQLAGLLDNSAWMDARSWCSPRGTIRTRTSAAGTCRPRSDGVSRRLRLRRPLVRCRGGGGGRAHRGHAGAAAGGNRGGDGRNARKEAAPG